MTSRPIMFCGEMVRAIREGRKTQTRRIAKQEECRYGVPGDRLWVKETWREAGGVVHYRADGSVVGVWQSPMFMPRRVSRIELEVVAVRRERLSEITEVDAKAEGAASRKAFMELWNRVAHIGRRWCDNPVVDVVEFRVVEEGEQ